MGLYKAEKGALSLLLWAYRLYGGWLLSICPCWGWGTSMRPRLRAKMRMGTEAHHLIYARQTSFINYHTFLFNFGVSLIIPNNPWLHIAATRGLKWAGKSRLPILTVIHYFISLLSFQNFRKILFKCFSLASAGLWGIKWRFRWPYLGQRQNGGKTIQW